MQLKPHAPLAHAGDPFAGAVHALPQLWQFDGSELVFTHDVPQTVSPPQLSPHAPLVQNGFDGSMALHDLPQVPQLLPSDWRLTQTPLQGV